MYYLRSSPRKFPTRSFRLLLCGLALPSWGAVLADPSADYYRACGDAPYDYAVSAPHLLTRAEFDSRMQEGFRRADVSCAALVARLSRLPDPTPEERLALFQATSWTRRGRGLLRRGHAARPGAARQQCGCPTGPLGLRGRQGGIPCAAAALPGGGPQASPAWQRAEALTLDGLVRRSRGGCRDAAPPLEHGLRDRNAPRRKDKRRGSHIRHRGRSGRSRSGRGNPRASAQGLGARHLGIRTPRGDPGAGLRPSDSGTRP